MNYCFGVKMVKISVIIPVYNAKEFLYDSIPSLLNQTLEDIELVCVNDGSKDNSLEILNEFASNDSRVKVFDKENGGCGSARNYALEHANGDYIYFFDPDDDIESDALKLAYENAEKNGSDLVIFQADTFDADGANKKDILFNYKLLKKEEYDDIGFESIRNYVLKGGYAPWSKLYKKELIDSYDDFKFDIGIAFDDVPFHVKSLLRANKISYMDKVLYHYRVDNANSVVNTSSNGFDIFTIIDKVEAILRKEERYDDLKKEFNIFKVNHILIYIISTDSEDYFQMAKERFKEVDSSFLGNGLRRKRYDLVLECESFEEFKPKHEILMLESKLNSLEKKQLKLKKENKKLKKENKALKKENEELLNSNSWKLTSPLRKLRK